VRDSDAAAIIAVYAEGAVGRRVRLPLTVPVTRRQAEVRAQAILADPAGAVVVERSEERTVLLASRLVERLEIVAAEAAP